MYFTMSQMLLDIPKNTSEIPDYIHGVIRQGKDLGVINPEFNIDREYFTEVVDSVSIFVENGETSKEFINTYVVGCLTGYQAGIKAGRKATH